MSDIEVEALACRAGGAQHDAHVEGTWLGEDLLRSSAKRWQASTAEAEGQHLQHRACQGPAPQDSRQHCADLSLCTGELHL